MKKANYSLIFIPLMMLLNSSISGQTTVLGNVASATTDFLGWNNNAANNFDLEIRHDRNQNINFWTNTNQRATILANGNIGIGTATPVRLLHLHSTTTVDVLTRYSNPYTATFSTVGGMEVGVDGAIGTGNGIIRHLNDLQIEIWTNADNTTIPRAIFTNSNFFGTSGSPGTLGAGLRILDPDLTPGGDLDIWTSTANQTHIVWGPNGRIQGINDRFEIQADFDDGLWFNVVDTTTGTFFNQVGQETGRI